MANNLTTNPIYLDTWTADFTIKSPSDGPLFVKCVRMLSDDSASRFLLEDKDGYPIVALGPSKSDESAPETRLTNGVYCDVSDCDHLDGHAKVLIYV